MPGTVSSASTLTDRSLSRQKYPNPFFDLSKVYMPKGVKSVLRFCRMFFYRNEFINSVLHKMTEYPITQLQFSNLSDPVLINKWKTILYHHVKIKTFLVEAGLDYHVFGNCFISAVQKFKRHLRCNACGETCTPEQVQSIKFTQHTYRGICPHCQTGNASFKIEDSPIKNINAINFVRWPAEQIDIVYDTLTGEREYYYTLSAETKNAISSGKVDKINKIPQIFIESVKQNKKIKLDPDNIFHLKRPGLSEEDMGWGKPTILPALSLIWYMQTLRRGNEAIALEHVVPMRAVFPASSGDASPLLQMNLAGWKSKITEELDKYKSDPNYIAVMPIPLGYQSLGGDAKSLLTTPELKFLEETIINSLGVPIEFVKGGTTWTGSSISLRIVENSFMSYREDLEDMLNYFIVPKIARMLQYEQVTLKFKRLRMSDDTETKNMAMQLNQMGKLADSILMQDFGYDQQENINTMSKDLEETQRIDQKRAAGQASIQSMLAVEQMRAQAKAEACYIEEKSIISEEMFAEEIASEAGTFMMGLDTTEFMRKLTAQLLPLPPENQAAIINGLSKRMPTVASLLMTRLRLGQEALLQAMPQTVESAQQDKELASKEEISQRRSSNKPSTKHTASKKGEPK